MPTQKQLLLGVARVIVVVSIVAGVTGMAGCSVFHDDYPDTSCNTDVDCFRAQGETCNTTTRTCEVPPDAAPLPDARQVPDAAPTPDADTTPDATPADANGADAT